MKRKLVLVEWRDACSTGKGAWTDMDSVCEMEPLSVASVGFLVAESKSHVTLAAHVSGGDGISENCMGELLIPRSGIVRRRDLKEKK